MDLVKTTWLLLILLVSIILKCTGMIILITNVLFYLVYYIAVQFIFTPSPNIGVYQLAHYQCSVDNTNMGISMKL